MSKRQKKKAPIAEGEPEVEIITKVEYIYEDTKATTGVEPDYKWGEIYKMIANQNVPDVSRANYLCKHQEIGSYESSHET